ncbi:MAG: Fic family protein [Bacteroidales bacterium]|jgi:Fic family protein|nr:Fic family protein [Bacteroidales bacterium]
MRRIYIYQQENWPNFTWNSDNLAPILGKVRNLQGRLVGRMESLGFELRSEATLETLTLDVLKSTEIEGEILDHEQVRSSIARRLGMNASGLIPSDRNIDGVVEMMLDATQNYTDNLSIERLFNWHSSLFPTGRSGMYKIIVGSWRDDSTGPMQVVSGALGKEKVHYQAPDAKDIEHEIKIFLNWFNSNQEIDPVLKSGIAHFWFVTLHPFEDGNGRIARAIADMLLTKSDGISQRFYSMSSQIRKERNKYYEVLEKTQKSSLDITEWLTWFIYCLQSALESSENTFAKVIHKHDFWNKNASKLQNNRQKKMLNKLLEGLEGKLTSSKWAKMTKCSPDSALRDIQYLIEKRILTKAEGGGRSTNYELNELNVD